MNLANQIFEQHLLANNFYSQKIQALKKNESVLSKVLPSSDIKPKRDEKLYDACLQFESIFIKQMLNAMRKNIQKSELINGGMAEEIFEDMLFDEYSLLMARTSRFGLADLVYRELSAAQAGLI